MGSDLVRSVATTILVSAVLVLGVGHPAVVAQGPVPHPPVDGGVLRPFQAPSSDFAAGHRGLDLAAPPGTPVRALAPGRVSHAGPVAGASWVSIDHGGGLVTSYGPLDDLRVAFGEEVAGGVIIANLAAGGHGPDAAPGLHLGARLWGTYVDPGHLLGSGPGRPSLVGAGGWAAAAPAVVPYAAWRGARAGGLLVHPSPRAQRPGFGVPPNPNHLVLVAGLASSSATRVLDADHLGYAADSVTQFSYAASADADGTPPPDYGPVDTWAGTGPAAERLAARLRVQARLQPGRAVDLVGHSMGGVVILRYLLEHHDPYDRSLPPIGHVVTVASPIRGSDLAGFGSSLLRHELAGPFLRAVQRGLEVGIDQLPLDAPAIAELAVGSPTLDELALAWDRAQREAVAGPLAMGTRVLTVGGSTDLVVAADRARVPARAMLAPRDGAGDVPAAEHRVLPGGHDTVLATEAVREVVWRFLAGGEVVDSPGALSTFVGRELGVLGEVAGTAIDISAWPLRLGAALIVGAPVQGP